MFCGRYGLSLGCNEKDASEGIVSPRIRRGDSKGEMSRVGAFVAEDRQGNLPYDLFPAKQNPQRDPRYSGPGEGGSPDGVTALKRKISHDSDEHILMFRHRYTKPN